jgi:hypothetical protein
MIKLRDRRWMLNDWPYRNEEECNKGKLKA